MDEYYGINLIQNGLMFKINIKNTFPSVKNFALKCDLFRRAISL